MVNLSVQSVGTGSSHSCTGIPNRVVWRLAQTMVAAGASDDAELNVKMINQERMRRLTYKVRVLGLCGLVLALVASGCQQQPQPQLVPTATKTFVVTATAFQTLTATATPPATILFLPTATQVNTLVVPTTTEANTSTVPPTPSCQVQGQVLAFNFNSRTLGRAVHYNLYLPPCYSESPIRLYPVLYLLHGANADDTQWLDLGAAPDADNLIQQHAIAPLVIVMPDGDYQSGEDYGAFVQSDLMPEIEKTARVERTREGRAIGGLSLGGYWALRLALTHPDLFGAVGGHSPATDSALLSNAAPNLQGLRIYLDVGRDDSLAPGVETFTTALRTRGESPEFHLNAGNHSRPYWRSHTREYLEFYADRQR